MSFISISITLSLQILMNKRNFFLDQTNLNLAVSKVIDNIYGVTAIDILNRSGEHSSDKNLKMGAEKAAKIVLERSAVRLKHIRKF